MKTYLLLWAALLSAVVLVGQVAPSTRVPGRLLVYFEQGVAPWGLGGRSQQHPDLIHTEQLGIRNNIHLYRFDEASVDADALLAWVQRQPGVVAAQWDMALAMRTTPDDEYYPQQTHLDRIGLPDAWDTTTGGYTPGGKTIVVAIMDSGFYPQHEDLANTTWTNPAEVPNDGIDNDANGYIDDLHGWDYFASTPNIAPGAHGLSVSGIIGAAGDNGIGVAGINWDVQLMLFTFQYITDLVKAYEYVIDQRQRFNETAGAEGAFVVATNNSFGVARNRCTQQAVWGAMYDRMGEVGILSSAGVSNERYNADLAGDMPGDCRSDYLIISTNTDGDDNLYANTAFGPVSVDMGAPGEDSYTTKPSNSYGFFGGNSAATPHVTGAIALLYSALCPDLEAQAIQQPAQAALFIKQQLLRGVEPLPSLANRTLTGGRLHVGNSMAHLTAACSTELGPLALLRVFPNPTDAGVEVNFQVPESGRYEAQLYNALGQRVYQQSIDVAPVGLRQFAMPTGHLPAGVYALRWGRGQAWASAKITVVR